MGAPSLLQMEDTFLQEASGPPVLTIFLFLVHVH